MGMMEKGSYYNGVVYGCAKVMQDFTPEQYLQTPVGSRP